MRLRMLVVCISLLLSTQHQASSHVERANQELLNSGYDLTTEKRFSSPEEFWRVVSERQQGELVCSCNPIKTAIEKQYSDCESEDAIFFGSSDQKMQTADVIHSLGLLSFLRIELGVCLGRVLELGSGNGRVTERVLSKIFERVDLVELSSKQIAFAKQRLSGNKRIGNFYNVDISDFGFEKTYDVIWVQWVISFVTDLELQKFLSKAQLHLSPQGVVVIKDVIEPHANFSTKIESKMYIRSLRLWKKQAKKAGYSVVFEDSPKGLSTEFEEIATIVLRPDASSNHQTTS